MHAALSSLLEGLYKSVIGSFCAFLPNSPSENKIPKRPPDKVNMNGTRLSIFSATRKSIAVLNAIREEGERKRRSTRNKSRRNKVQSIRIFVVAVPKVNCSLLTVHNEAQMKL